MRPHTLFAAAAIALVGGLVAPAGAAAVPARSSMTITVHNAEPRQEREKWTLECEPPGGTHGNARQACAALDEVNGNFAALEPLPGMCTAIYQPVVITVRGHWRDRRVRFARMYPNRCVAGLESGGVFRFTPAY